MGLIMNRILTISIFLLACTPLSVFAQERNINSIFFSDAEIIEAEKLSNIPDSYNSDTITLKAILFISPDDWSVWIGPHKFTPEFSTDWFKILEVTPDSVAISVNNKIITLSPKQSYKISSDEFNGIPLVPPPAASDFVSPANH